MVNSSTSRLPVAWPRAPGLWRRKGAFVTARRDLFVSRHWRFARRLVAFMHHLIEHQHTARRDRPVDVGAADLSTDDPPTAFDADGHGIGERLYFEQARPPSPLSRRRKMKAIEDAGCLARGTGAKPSGRADIRPRASTPARATALRAGSFQEPPRTPAHQQRAAAIRRAQTPRGKIAGIEAVDMRAFNSASTSVPWHTEHGCSCIGMAERKCTLASAPSPVCTIWRLGLPSTNGAGGERGVGFAQVIGHPARGLRCFSAMRLTSAPLASDCADRDGGGGLLAHRRPRPWARRPADGRLKLGLEFGLKALGNRRRGGRSQRLHRAVGAGRLGLARTPRQRPVQPVRSIVASSSVRPSFMRDQSCSRPLCADIELAADVAELGAQFRPCPSARPDGLASAVSAPQLFRGKEAFGGCCSAWAAKSRTSWLICIEQNFGPHIEQKCADFAPSAGRVWS